MNKLIPMMLIVACSALATGCGGQRVTTADWQKSYEQFATEHSNGDLGFVRARADESGRRQFTAISAKSPDESTDITGLLLGRRPIMGIDYDIFVVGEVKDRDIADVRIAMLSASAGKPQWKWSRNDQASLQTYRRAHVITPSAQASGERNMPSNFNGFPAERDVFDLEVIGNTIAITERTSHSRWTMVLTDEQTKPVK